MRATKWTKMTLTRFLFLFPFFFFSFCYTRLREHLDDGDWRWSKKAGNNESTRSSDLAAEFLLHVWGSSRIRRNQKKINSSKRSSLPLPNRLQLSCFCKKTIVRRRISDGGFVFQWNQNLQKIAAFHLLFPIFLDSSFSFAEMILIFLTIESTTDDLQMTG